MKKTTKRTTIYLDPDLHKALRLKAMSISSSVSELISEAVRESLSEDTEDFATFEQRVNEPLVSYDEMVQRLKNDVYR
jgi:hypothetical protein